MKKTLSALILAAVGGAYALLPSDAVEVAFAGQVCYLDDKQFVLQWRHSVEHQLWREHYRTANGKLYLEQTELQTFGAGTPSSGKPMPSEKGFIGQQSDVVLNELNWAVSHNMQGEIQTPERIWQIYRQTPDYSTIRIAPVRIARWQKRLRKCND